MKDTIEKRLGTYGGGGDLSEALSNVDQMGDSLTEAERNYLRVEGRGEIDDEEEE